MIVTIRLEADWGLPPYYVDEGDGPFELYESDDFAERFALPEHVIRALDEWDHLTHHTDAVAKRFIGVFEDHLLPEGWREHLDPDTVRELAATLRRLQHLAGQVTLAALDASVAKVGSRRVGELVPHET